MNSQPSTASTSAPAPSAPALAAIGLINDAHVAALVAGHSFPAIEDNARFIDQAFLEERAEHAAYRARREAWEKELSDTYTELAKERDRLAAENEQLRKAHRPQ